MTAVLENQENSIPDIQNDSINAFQREVKNYPLLTLAEEQALALGCANGEEDAIRTMVNAHLRMLVKIASEFKDKGIPMWDLIQEGSLGLMNAARNFDHTQGARFSTYAATCIRQYMQRYALIHGSLIYIPEKTMRSVYKVKAISDALEKELGRQPELCDIASAVGMDEKKVRELLEQIPQVCSLDVPAGEDSTLEQLLENLQTPQPQDELVCKELKKSLDMLLGMLSERQREILQLHFGLMDGKCLSLEQIGSRYGISKQRARQIEQQAIEKLKKLGAGIGLEDFLE